MTFPPQRDDLDTQQSLSPLNTREIGFYSAEIFRMETRLANSSNMVELCRNRALNGIYGGLSMKRYMRVTTILIALGALNSPAWARGEESFGNSRVSPANYREWPGMARIIDDTHRVYRSWVNGDEHFYFQGDTQALNDSLKAFSAMESPVHEVILRTGHATARTFHGDQVPYDWVLHIAGGIARHGRRDKTGKQVLDNYPTLTVYVNDNTIDLETIRVPANVAVLGPDALRTHNLAGVKSKSILVSYGNSPLNPLDYRDWRGIIPVLDDPHRVYTRWVNSNERYFYQGDTQALNESLKAFVAIEAPVHEVILRPGPAKVRTLRGDKISYDWALAVMGGISSHLHREDVSTRVFDKYPTLTVYVGGNVIDLEKIKVPEGVTVLDLSNLRARYLAGLRSSNDQVPGYAAMYLAQLDPYQVENVAPIAALLHDEDIWVRLMAIGALLHFGEPARAVLVNASERIGLEEREREKLESALDHIDQMKIDADGLKAHEVLLERISAFRKSL